MFACIQWWSFCNSLCLKAPWTTPHQKLHHRQDGTTAIKDKETDCKFRSMELPHIIRNKSQHILCLEWTTTHVAVRPYYVTFTGMILPRSVRHTCRSALWALVWSSVTCTWPHQHQSSFILWWIRFSSQYCICSCTLVLSWQHSFASHLSQSPGASSLLLCSSWECSGQVAGEGWNHVVFQCSRPMGIHCKCCVGSIDMYSSNKQHVA